MPQAYLKLRNDLISQGVPRKEAKSRAAASYNKTHPDKPVTAAYDRKHSARSTQRARQARKGRKRAAPTARGY